MVKRNVGRAVKARDSAVVTLRIPKPEREQLREIAEQRGQSMAAFCESVIARTIKRMAL